MTRKNGILSTAVIGVLLYFSFFGAIAVNGSVLNAIDEQPIAGIPVTLDCKMASLHGSASLSKASTVTDENGRFRFGVWDSWFCPTIQIDADTDQYFLTAAVDLRYYRDFTRLMPNKLYLTLRTDQDLQERRYREASIREPIPEPVWQYERLFNQFDAARAGIYNPEGQQRIRAEFCERLTTAYSALSQEHRDGLASGRYRSAPIDHARIVAANCNGH